MSRPRVALWIAAVFALFGIFVEVGPYFEAEGENVRYGFFVFAALSVLYAVLDLLASSYRRRHVKR